MERKELIESLEKWDKPPYVAEASLEMIHSHVLNETPLLFKRWYELNDVIIITPNRQSMTYRLGVRADLESRAIIDEAIAIGKVMRHIDIATDGIIHRYSEVEIISFYPEGSQFPIDDIELTVIHPNTRSAISETVIGYLQKILTSITLR